MATIPKTRSEFWLEKFAQNVARDARNDTALRRSGWEVATVWECETREPEELLIRLDRWLSQMALPNSRLGK
jgi:DNA mismatch endonuclease, patch repair protein